MTPQRRPNSGSLGDAIIFNVIEFWSGKQVFAEAPRVRAIADGTLEIRAGDEVLQMVKVKDNHFRVVRDGHTVGHGHLRADGTIELVDLSGQRRAVVPLDKSAS